MWLNQRAGKMKGILGSDWLPKRARWAYLALPKISYIVLARKSSLFGHIINPLLTKLVQSRWLDIGQVLFCVFMDRDRVEDNNNAKENELGQCMIKQSRCTFRQLKSTLIKQKTEQHQYFNCTDLVLPVQRG